MLDYLTLQGTTENPTFLTMLFTVLLAFLLSSLIAFTYEKTTRKVISAGDFLQALILLAIVAATVMQAIGDSLARGLGMLGALAVIRFRTTLRAPRNMAFTFASLAAGIACGVYGFVIAVTGTVGFCAAAFALRFSPLSTQTNLIGVLTFSLPVSSRELGEIEATLDRFCQNYNQFSYQIIQPKAKKSATESTEKIVNYEYHLKLKKESEAILLDSVISNLETIELVRLSFRDSAEVV